MLHAVAAAVADVEEKVYCSSGGAPNTEFS
jgi:hypothetical protein